jgi:hypothetical protein
MSPILGIYASQITGHLVTNNYSSIQTVTVGSGGASSITFSSIPSTYTHLQIRGIARDASGNNNGYIQFNGDTGSNYSYHYLVGGGSSASAGGAASATNSLVMQYNNGSNMFGATILDILDYANTNKNKTVRSLNGWDQNGSGSIFMWSGLWMNTSAISSITLTEAGNFAQYSSFALYGVK